MFFKEKLMKKVYLTRTIGIVLTVFMMAFIFSMSSQNATLSNETSAGVIRFTVSLVYPEFNELGEIAQNEIVSSFQNLVRSFAHFGAFAALCFFSLIFTLTLEKIKLLLRYVSSVVFAFLYAVSDEIHQLFIPGRAFQLFDILVDSLGIMLGAAVMYLIMKLIKKRTLI